MGRAAFGPPRSQTVRPDLNSSFNLQRHDKWQPIHQKVTGTEMVPFVIVLKPRRLRVIS